MGRIRKFVGKITGSSSNATDDDHDEEERKNKPKRKSFFGRKKRDKTADTTDGNTSDEEPVVKEKKKKPKASGGSGRQKAKEKAESTTDGESTDDKKRTGETTEDNQDTTDAEQTGDTSKNTSAEEGGMTGGKALHKTGKNKSDSESESYDDEEETSAKKAPTKGKANFMIRVAVYEAKQLMGTNISPVCRVTIADEIVRQTPRRRSTNEPDWNYIFASQLTRVDRDDLHNKQIVFSVIDTSATAIGDVARIGTASCSLGVVYAQPRHSVLHKWMALEDSSAGNQDDGDAQSKGINGFVKISISVLPADNSGPSLKRVAAGKQEDVLFGSSAQMKTVTLYVDLHHITDMPLLQWKKNDLIVVEVDTGQTKRSMKGGRFRSKAIQIEDGHIGERVSLPIMWPSVSSGLTFRLYAVGKKDSNKVINRTRGDRDDDKLFAKATLALKDICASGEDGFMPTFGPAYVSMYGADMLNRGQRRKQVDEGHHFTGRLLLALSTDESSISAIKKTALSSVNTVVNPKAKGDATDTSFTGVQKKEEHVLYCVFEQATHVHHSLQEEAISLQVSMGAYGNAACHAIDRTGNCTPFVTPMCNKGWMGYAIPWGSHKPTAEVHCSWEMCWHRVYATAYLVRLANTLTEAADQAQRELGFDAAKLDDPLCMVIEDALIQCLNECARTASPVNTVALYDKTGAPLLHGQRVVLTELDRHLCQRRVTKMLKIKESIWRDSFVPQSSPRALSVLTARARDLAAQFMSLSKDAQMSIPDVHVLLVKGVINKKPVAYCRIPAESIYYSKTVGERGVRCGQSSGQYMKWLGDSARTQGPNTLPVFLHARLFLAPLSAKHVFAGGASHTEQPLMTGCRLARYAEVWENQTWRGSWQTAMAKVKPFTNEDGTSAVLKDSLTLREGFTWESSTSNWEARSSHDYWTIEGRAGKETFYEEEAYELQRKSKDKWIYETCTDVAGNKLAFVYDDDKAGIVAAVQPQDMDASKSIAKIGATLQSKVPPPDGYIWSAPWRVDTRNGDHGGWTYALSESALNNSHVMENKEMVHHKHRRRRWVGSVVGTKAAIQQRWEYATKFGKPTHTQPHTSDWTRRQRWLRTAVLSEASEDKISPLALQYPIVNSGAAVDTATTDTTDADVAKQETVDLFSAKRRRAMQMYMSPRLYVAHDFSTRWELRAYMFWGRHLLPTTKSGRIHAYCKIIFMDRTACTAAVDNNMNPIFNETICFPRVMLVGSTDVMQAGGTPPVLVEVYSANVDGPDDFIGRFDVKPHAYLPGDHLWRTPRLTWYPLTRAPHTADKTASLGSIMCSFVLYHAADREAVPLAPEMKPIEVDQPPRYSVPPHIKLKFVVYDIQLVTFGVRKLKKHQLLTPRKPFVCLVAGDQQRPTATISDAKQCPNWPAEDMLLAMHGVMLPENLHQMPPILMTLNNVGLFGSRPVLGTCEIDDVHAFIVNDAGTKKDKDEQNIRETTYVEFDKHVRDSAKLLPQHEFVARQSVDETEMRLIDWWSKYYASTDEPKKAPKYCEARFDRLRIYDCALENVDGYDGFSDFATSFDFAKGGRRKEEGTVRGSMKGRLVIAKRTQAKVVSPLMSKLPPGINALSGEYIVRVYCVLATNLVSQRRSGNCLPYVNVTCGTRKLNNRKLTNLDTLNPTIGHMVEMKIKLPQQSTIVVAIKDKRRGIIKDENIGETEIDLENRWLTKYRATVGLSQQYNVIGINKWRDQQSPMAILLSFCRLHDINAPEFSKSEDGEWSALIGKQRVTLTDVDKEMRASLGGNLSAYIGDDRERLALAVLHKMGLVPEHIEQRPLTNSSNPGVVTGVLSMWVDILPTSLGRIPEPVNITPRAPQSLQLRVCVHNVRDALMERMSCGVPSADLFIKAYVDGLDKTQSTDVHYRSEDGSGSFNWRLVFNVESVFVHHKKAHFWHKSHTDRRVKPVLVVQLFDNHKFKRDGYVGQLKINLLDMDDAQPLATRMANVSYQSGSLISKATCKRWVPCYWCFACLFSCVRGCFRSCFSCCRARKTCRKLEDMPDYVENVVPKSNMFDRKRTSGWFPCTRVSQASTGGRASKKSDDRRTTVEKVTGKVELTIDLVDGKAARKEPVGKGRSKPNHSPVLPAPDRPLGDSWWLTSRIKGQMKRMSGWMTIGVIMAIIIGLIILAVIFAGPELLAAAL